MDIIRKLTFVKVGTVIIYAAFLISSASANTYVAADANIMVTASCSDSDCDYTGDCPESVGDTVTITWSDDTLRDSGVAFPNGNTGTSVLWKAPGGAGDVVITATCNDTGTTKYNDSSQSDQVTVTVVKVDKLQYNDPTSGWTDVTGTLYVHKGGSIEFKAIKSPADASWPSGKPVWGGTSGASGTGETKNVTFNTISSNSTDYKTVTAECGNTVTANVIVCEVEMTDIQFDHDDPASGHNDALNIYDVTAPEWVNGSKNEPAVYIKNTSNIDIKARFSISPAVGPTTKILATTGSSVLGNVNEVSGISFSSGSSGYVRFTAGGSAASTVDESTVQWQWKVKAFGNCSVAEININTSGPHTIYTIYDNPVCSASDFVKDNLDGAVAKAIGESTESGIASTANDNVGDNVYQYGGGCICSDGFQKNFDAAMGSYPSSGDKGMCCCRAEGLDCVLNVLGIGPYTHDYVNERPEPNPKYIYVDHCNICGKDVFRNYWDGFWNNWEGVVKVGGTGSMCYVPANGSISIDEGTYSAIDSAISSDCGYYWQWGRNFGDTCPHLGAP